MVLHRRQKSSHQAPGRRRQEMAVGKCGELAGGRNRIRGRLALKWIPVDSARRAGSFLLEVGENAARVPVVQGYFFGYKLANELIGNDCQSKAWTMCPECGIQRKTFRRQPPPESFAILRRPRRCR